MSADQGQSRSVLQGALPDGLELALHRLGLTLRGGFNFETDEDRPEGPNGEPAASLVLVGHAGGTMWPHFSRWLEGQAERPANPLDTWSGEVIDAIAEAFGAQAVFPWQKPYWPFQQWAKRAEGLEASPLGMLIHPEYGLWHAWRGALVFNAPIPIQRVEKVIHRCTACVEKPCLSACPVSAFDGYGFDAASCRSWLDSTRSQTDSSASGCVNEGCRARDACPIGREYRYPDAQIRFHMEAFRRA